MIGTWHAVVIDCEDTEIMAAFYEELLGMVRVQHDDDGWITIGDAPDRPAIAFQRVENYVPPEWPGHLHPQQAHLDIRVDDLDLAEEAVLKIGATSMNTGGQNYRVYLDPQRHPFCLVNW